jgi:hypothetical protein
MAEQQTEPSQAANCDQIPIIDLSTIDSPDIEERRELARAIYDACTQVGFFYIKVLIFQARGSGYIELHTNIGLWYTRTMGFPRT